MANRNGWMVILDPGTWVRALLAAAFMWVLAFAVTLARDTTEHDRYAAGKLTLTELVTGLGFDDRAPVEYRMRDGAVVTLTRDGLMYNRDALLARDRLLRTAAKAAGLGAWCGLGGALIGLVLCLRPEDEWQHRRAAPGPEHLQRPEARARFAPPGVRSAPAVAPPAPGSALVPAPENRPSVSRASPPPGKDGKASGAGKPPARADSRQPDAPVPPPPARRKPHYGRWI